MYIPKPFSVSPGETLRKLLPGASFATLVTSVAGALPAVTHLPVSFDPQTGVNGTIRGHVARANPHWRLFDAAPSLILFHGPHMYISPRDYATTVNVPTWNYVSVHAGGPVRILDNPADVRAVLETLTAENERDRERPWTISEVGESRVEGLMKAIVAFELTIETFEAKAKLGQNKAAEDRAALRHAASGGEMEAWQAAIE
jgi:transcriptional regulator